MGIGLLKPIIMKKLIISYKRLFVPLHSFCSSELVPDIFIRQSDQCLSLGNRPVITIYILLFSLSNVDAIFIIPLGMSCGLLWLILFVLQWMIMIWAHMGISVLPARPQTYCTRSPPMLTSINFPLTRVSAETCSNRISRHYH